MKTYKNPQTEVRELATGLLCSSGDPKDRIGGGTLNGGVDHSVPPGAARVKHV